LGHLLFVQKILNIGLDMLDNGVRVFSVSVCGFCSFYQFLIKKTQSYIMLNDERYQLDIKIVIYYHKYLYIFRASICPNSGVQAVCYCIWCSAPCVVAVVLRSWCAVLCTVCKFVSYSHIVHKTTHQLLRTTITTPGAEHHMQ